MSHPHINPMGFSRVVDRLPASIVQMPQWPGAAMAIALAERGAREKPPIGLALNCADGSQMIIEYQLVPAPGTPEDVYARIGDAPWLVVMVLDKGVGIRRRNSIPERWRPNDGERYVAELHKLLGKDRPLAVVGSALVERDTRRRYFWSI